MSRVSFVFCLILAPSVLMAFIVFIVGGDCLPGLLDWQNSTESCKAKFNYLSYNPLLQLGTHVAIFIVLYTAMARIIRLGLSIYFSVLVPLTLLVACMQPGGYLATQIYAGFSNKNSLLIVFLSLFSILVIYPSYGFLITNERKNFKKRIANLTTKAILLLSLVSVTAPLNLYLLTSSLNKGYLFDRNQLIEIVGFVQSVSIIWTAIDFLIPFLLLLVVLLQLSSGHVEADKIEKENVERRERLLGRAAIAAIVFTAIAYFLTAFMAGTEASFAPYPSTSLLDEKFYLPTAIMYFVIFYFAFDAWGRRNKTALIGLIVALLVPGTWVLEQLRVMGFILDEKASIAALKLNTLEVIPDTLVVTKVAVNKGVYWKTKELQHLVVRHSDQGLLRYDRKNGGRTPESISTEELPEKYLLLKIDEESAFSGERRRNGNILLSKNILNYELYLVEKDEKVLVGIHVITNWTWPSTLPLLTPRGWVFYGAHRRVSNYEEMKWFLNEVLVAKDH